MVATLSLLDRLINLRPELKREPPMTCSAADVRAGLCRDLTALLNARRATEDFDREFEGASNSILTFGITDFTSYNLKKGMEQEQLRRSIEKAIQQFEPRLERVMVSIDEEDQHRPVLRLQISAVLRMNAEPILLDATLHRDSRQIALSGGA